MPIKPHQLLRISELGSFNYCRLVKCRRREMNHQDAYIYIGKKHVYSWIGSEASEIEQSKVKVIGRLIAEENNMKLKVINNKIKILLMR